ncbi:MAG TPA: tyrosinase family protein [Luteimonas sp.]|nr:tyrosinase family protein [Luteimonas sp.]
MVSTSRRNFVRGLATIPLALWVARNARADGPLVRYDANSPIGQEMLQVYAGAVAAMKLRPEFDPLSWTWQWYTHFVDGTTTKAAELARIFGSEPGVAGALANEMWNTCQSHAGQNANNFLPWHRMYVLFFENIIRQVSGRPDFTLPYWNYTASDPALCGVLPQAFRLPNDLVFESLYRPDRIKLANNGKPIHKNQPGNLMDISVPMGKASYSSSGGVQGFCRAIDSGIHGSIHVLVGNKYNMGAVPYAARDPLFWVHHANIDRLWASWNLNGGTNPALAWANKAFVFADGLGQRVSSRLRDYFDIATLGYTYDSFESPPAPPMEGAALRRIPAMPGAAPELVARALPAELGAEATRSLLRPVAGAARTAVLGLDLDRAPRRTWLVLKDLHAWHQPEVLYHVYLGPGRGPAGAGRGDYVGSINFFDAEFHDHGGGKLDEALGENFFSFDVTALLDRLATRGNGNARDSLAVTFQPGGHPAADARPLVASIELVRQ